MLKNTDYEFLLATPEFAEALAPVRMTLRDTMPSVTAGKIFNLLLLS